MSLDQVRAYFGFTKMPFGKSLPPSALYKSASHQEAVARLSFLVSEQAIGVLTGEVGSGKSVAARAAVAGLDPSRHSVIYLANPAVGARGLYAEVVSRLGGGAPLPQGGAHRPGHVAVGGGGFRAGPGRHFARRPMPSGQLCRGGPRGLRQEP